MKEWRFKDIKSLIPSIVKNDEAKVTMIGGKSANELNYFKKYERKN